MGFIQILLVEQLDQKIYPVVCGSADRQHPIFSRVAFTHADHDSVDVDHVTSPCHYCYAVPPNNHDNHDDNHDDHNTKNNNNSHNSRAQPSV